MLGVWQNNWRSVQKVVAMLFVMSAFFVGSAAHAGDELFDVKIPISDSDANLSKQDQFDKALAEASRVELMRLTGRLDINDDDEFQELLQNPKDWLSRYSYQPIVQEGVAVGTQIEFSFDRKHIYQYFQKHNLVLWPYSNRPKTLVFGSQKLGNDTVNLNADALEDNPALDYRKPAERMGVPVLEPSNAVDSSLWVYPLQNASPEQIVFLESQVKADYLMTYQEEVSETGDKAFHWELFDKQGQKVLDGQADNTLAMDNLKDIFARLLDYYSQGYRAQADILGSLTLTLDNVKQVEDLESVETALNNLKPVVHSVRLNTLQNNQANFEIIYQGIYSNLLTKIQQIPHVLVTDNDAVIGVVQAKWSDEAQPNQPVDSSTGVSPDTAVSGSASSTPLAIQGQASSSAISQNPQVEKGNDVQTEGAVIETMPQGESIAP
ncbi:DUF2066 domain-containing protein [Hydrogenovibrio sp. JE_KL2]|uniref:DUF2066 domain-containing protein n=1 Tax=Hydrogenovibrio sp. JE_KL2 TaxID=2651188 RepID=UPI00128C0D4E|nr:DUF2066 domain-containing protein [Hydrogenovibrio sp. JE_KL2]MPQ75837.1 DUF2066 domain-containing protein [Hydrogenovibrio sp. JE_KL2]